MISIKKKIFQIYIILLNLILLLAPFSFSLDSLTQSNLTNAQTEITQDTTWIVANSPYLIRESVYVGSNATLTIEPGVVIKLEASSLIVEGNLKALGTETNKIIFTSYYDDEYGGNSDGISWQPQAGDWTNIQFNSGATGQLDNCLVRYGGQMEAFPVRASDKLIKPRTALAQFTFTVGAISVYDSQVEINNSIITNNKRGIEAAGSQAQLLIRNSKIYNNIDYGVYNEPSNHGQIDAINNWWGNDSGPRHSLNPQGTGDRVTDNVLFDPWIGKKAGLTPVIIIPGIIGSYLNKNEPGKPEVWPNIIEMAKIGSDSYLNDLAMNDVGWPNENLLPTDIIREILTKNFFQGLITELKSQGYQEEENLFVFPYDWRYFIEWSANEGDPYPLVKSLKEKVEEVKIQTGAEKVNLISHSMGGLVAKYYLKYYGHDSVDKFIDIATPHFGSPKAFKILMYGDDLGFKVFNYSILNPTTIKSISQNMPSIYQLLPSKNYFFNTDKDYTFYLADIHDLDENGVKGKLNYDQSIEFIKNTGRNDYLLGFNDTLHNALDGYSPKLDGIKTYNIIGCGSPTLGQIFVLNKEKSGKYEYGLKYINGDGTVPLRSAESLLSDESYYLNGTEHAYLASVDGVKQLVTAILKGEEGSFDFSAYSNLRQDKTNCSFSGKQISFHSPVELNVYDEAGNHLGPNQDGDIEMGIMGAQYDVIDDNKFVFLPAGHNYEVIGKATSSGTFNARIQNINDSEYNQTVYYNEIPLETAETNVKLEITDNQTDFTMLIDQDGDQIFETQSEPDSILNKEDSQDFTKPQTTINIIGTPGNNDWYVFDVKIELTAQDNENGSGILKTDYSLDNGLTWQKYSEPIILNQDGEYALLYQSTDKAGNIEETQGQKIKLDKTAPVIDTIIPSEGQEFLHSDILNLEYQLADSLSGIATNTLAFFIDNQIMDNNSKEVDLFNYNLGEHNLKITAQDQAGNNGEKEVKFIIGASIDSTISDINRSYKEGFINKKLIKDYLVKQLEWAKKYSERCGQKTKKNKICLKIILIQYQIILKQLDFYHQKKWVDDRGYNIIKNDITWLINDLKD